MERHNGIEPDPEGAFVYYADAQAQIEALQAVIRQMGEQAAVLEKDGMAAKAQVKALRRERDTARRRVDELLGYTLDATPPAPQTDEQRFIAACCERPDDCKWGGTGGCGYEGRQPKGGDGE